jgi:hypothetical protein
MEKRFHFGKGVICRFGMMPEHVTLLLRIDSHPIKAVKGLGVYLNCDFLRHP